MGFHNILGSERAEKQLTRKVTKQPHQKYFMTNDHKSESQSLLTEPCDKLAVWDGNLISIA